MNAARKTAEKEPDVRTDGGQATRLRFAFWAAIAAAALATIFEVTVATASGGTFNLGGLTKAVNPYQPLGFFRRAGTVLLINRCPAMMFLGSQFDTGSPGERWSIVKALEQFGNFRGLHSATGLPVCDPSVTDHCTLVPGPASFDWVHAAYISQFIAFDHKDILDVHQKALQSLTRAEQKVFQQYAYRKVPKRLARQYPNPYYSVVGPHWPVLVIGDYVETGTGVPTADLEDALGKPYSFVAIQQALQVDDVQRLGGAVGPINVEANIITALVCHADGHRPAHVCKQPEIRSVLADVR